MELVLRHSRMPGEADPLPALLRDFERGHPGVTVCREPLPWTADVQHQFFVINLEGRSAGFDVLMLDVIWVPEFPRAGWLLDLTGRRPAADRATHVPAKVRAATLEGRVWAVPWVMNVGRLYYRADLLARHGLAPPRSYADLARRARHVVEGRGATSGASSGRRPARDPGPAGPPASGRLRAARRLAGPYFAHPVPGTPG